MARGVNSLIDDRFDLTLECIKRLYKKIKSFKEYFIEVCFLII